MPRPTTNNSTRLSLDRIRARAAPLRRYLSVLFKQYGAYARLARLHKPIGIWLLVWPALWTNLRKEERSLKELLSEKSSVPSPGGARDLFRP